MTTDNPHTADTPDSAPPGKQTRNPLHGLTLEAILTELVSAYGWEDLGQQINIRCFISDPSIPSSLKFLRKTPWAREKVEGLFLFMQREQRRGRLTSPQAKTVGGDANSPTQPDLRHP